MSNHLLPWERPTVAMILQIFGGKVASVTTATAIQMSTKGGIEPDGEIRVQG